MLKAIVFAMLFGLSTLSYGAALRATDGISAVTITDGDCTSKVARGQLVNLNVLLARALRPPVEESDLHGGMMTYQGKPYEICWVRIEDIVVVMDDGGEDTSTFIVPAAAFRRLDDI